MIVEVVLVAEDGGTLHCTKGDDGIWRVKLSRALALTPKVIAVYEDGTTTEHSIIPPTFTLFSGMTVDVTIKGIL